MDSSDIGLEKCILHTNMTDRFTIHDFYCSVEYFHVFIPC